jgi:hypothetical protein
MPQQREIVCFSSADLPVLIAPTSGRNRTASSRFMQPCLEDTTVIVIRTRFSGAMGAYPLRQATKKRVHGGGYTGIWLEGQDRG